MNSHNLLSLPLFTWKTHRRKIDLEDYSESHVVWKIDLEDYSQSHVVISAKYLEIFQRKVMDTIIENKTREVKHKEREKKGKNNS